MAPGFSGGIFVQVDTHFAVTVRQAIRETQTGTQKGTGVPDPQRSIPHAP